MICRIAAMLMLILVGCGKADRSLHLVGWPDGTNNAFDIEAEYGKGQIVVVPDVRYIQTNERFVIGKADWKYLEGFPKSSNNIPNTNEFWFVLDKRVAYPKCYTSLTTNEQQWIVWCDAHNLSTNLLPVNRFVQFAETNLWHWGEHRL